MQRHSLRHHTLTPGLCGHRQHRQGLPRQVPHAALQHAGRQQPGAARTRAARGAHPPRPRAHVRARAGVQGGLGSGVQASKFQGQGSSDKVRRSVPHRPAEGCRPGVWQLAVRSPPCPGPGPRAWACNSAGSGLLVCLAIHMMLLPRTAAPSSLLHQGVLHTRTAAQLPGLLCAALAMRTAGPVWGGHQHKDSRPNPQALDPQVGLDHVCRS